ncbi:MAG TPA: anaerobic ribonucleoside-triphosphate reductase [Spirochaetota bacterium]|nr:anaerobic ribonucleoside-triphosphate reductase [Spirochaetota bacterium]
MKTKMVPTEIYSRVVGYYRPVNQWNKGKQSEFADRKEYDVNTLTLASEQTEKEAIAV